MRPLHCAQLFAVLVAGAIPWPPPIFGSDNPIRIGRSKFDERRGGFSDGGGAGDGDGGGGSGETEKASQASRLGGVPPERSRLLGKEDDEDLLQEVDGDLKAQVVGYEVALNIRNQGKSDVSAIVSEDGRTATYHFEHVTDAPYTALHFKQCHLMDGCVMEISNGGGSDADGSNGSEDCFPESVQYVGEGRFHQSNFWAKHTCGNKATITVTCPEDALKDGKFAVDSIAAGYPEDSDEVQDVEDGGRRLAICGTDDKRNANCYNDTHHEEWNKTRAVARLLIGGTKACTGFLVSDNNHFITNKHCIKNQNKALNTDYEFMAHRFNCAANNCVGCGVQHPGYAIFEGATFLTSSHYRDYSLLQFDATTHVSATYGFIKLSNQPTEDFEGEEIFIPQHPEFRAKEIALNSTEQEDSSTVTCHFNELVDSCTRKPYDDVGYKCDTKGGSSGSPVILRSTNSTLEAIGLHRCGGCENKAVPTKVICWHICQDTVLQNAGICDC